MSRYAELREKRARLQTELDGIADKIESGLAGYEGHAERGNRLKAGIEKIDAELVEARAVEIEKVKEAAKKGGALEPSQGDIPGGWRGSDPMRHPLALTGEYLDRVQAGIDNARMGRVEQRATVVLTTDIGARRVWGSNTLNGPRLLHVVGGAETQQSDATFAQHPILTLPSAAAGVGEGVTLTEFDAAAPGSVTLLRYGRFTDLAREALISADAGAIMGVHRLSIARDLDAALQAKLETDAGAAVAFSADVKGNIRKLIATVADTTASSPMDLVVISHPDNVALLEDVTAASGDDIGQPFPRFAGATVYATSVQDTGFMLVANLRVGVRYFEAQSITTENDWNIKTSTLTVSTSVIGQYGTGIISGYVKSQDVVTP